MQTNELKTAWRVLDGNEAIFACTILPPSIVLLIQQTWGLTVRFSLPEGYKQMCLACDTAHYMQCVTVRDKYSPGSMTYILADPIVISVQENVFGICSLYCTGCTTTT